MSIATKTGDSGLTSLMYNRRLPKSHPQVEAFGSVDELNSTLGVARAAAEHEFVRENLLAIQTDLVILMGELATAPDDLSRYVKDGFSLVTPQLTRKLDTLVQEIESQKVSVQGWATPGSNTSSAALDLARSACRRAERRVCDLQQHHQLSNLEIIVYLNRLSDALWLIARWVEARANCSAFTAPRLA